MIFNRLVEKLSQNSEVHITEYYIYKIDFYSS